MCSNKRTLLQILLGVDELHSKVSAIEGGAVDGGVG